MDSSSSVARAVLTTAQRRERDAKRILAARGLVEVVTWSFTSSALAKHFGDPDSELNLANPISSDLDVMRPNLLANLMGACGRNIDRGETQIGLFEVGAVYEGVAPDAQRVVAAGLRHGRMAARHWAGKGRDADVFDAKADALAVLEALGVPLAAAQTTADAPDWYHPGRSGTLRLGPKTVLACFGDIHPRVLHDLDMVGPLTAFEVFLDALPLAKGRKGYTRARLDASDLPAVDRDFAFLVDENVLAGDLARAAASADKDLIADVSIFDVYTRQHDEREEEEKGKIELGGQLPLGKKSLAISVRLQPTEQTLTEAEIEAVSGKVVAAVEKATGGRLRS